MAAFFEPGDRQWDAFVRSHPDGHLLQLRGWSAIKATAGWRSRRILLDAGATQAGAQVLVRRRWGLAAAYVPRGPLLSGEAATDAQLIDTLTRLARWSGAVFLRIEPNLLRSDEGADAFDALLTARGFIPAMPTQPLCSIHLDIAPEPEQLLAGMSKGHRADVRRAARDGVTVRQGGASDLDIFYRILEETATRAEFGIHSRDYYAAVLQTFGEEARLWIAEVGGEAHATAITAAGPHDALYLYSGSSAAGLRSGAQHAIQWAAIQWARERGCRRYDFWGVPAAFGEPGGEDAARNDPLYGVYRFKKGFGGVVARYLPAFDRVFLPPLYALWRRRTAG
jgi:lipid II:glycine glycyltransferase (peptidoglycan interpeptide bridge formation enzyme)